MRNPSNMEDEVRRFLKFKGLVQGMISSVAVNHWCLRHGVEIVQEIPEISPMEVFFIGLRTEGADEMSPGVEALVARVGDRVPVSDNEDFAYLFPRDLYEKILLFETVPA